MSYDKGEICSLVMYRRFAGFFKKRRRSGPQELSTNVTLTQVQEQLNAMGIPWTTFAAYAALPDKLIRIIAA